MRNFDKRLFKPFLLIAAVMSVGAWLYVAFSPLTSEKSEKSSGGVVAQDIIANARNFGSDCAAAKAYHQETGGDARCKPPGSLGVIISNWDPKTGARNLTEQ